MVKIINSFLVVIGLFILFNSSFIFSKKYNNYKKHANKIDNIIKSSNNSNFNLGVEIYSLNNKKIIYSINSNKKFTPASNTKILTSLCALDTLGPDYQFLTQICSISSIKENIIYGDIYLKSSGDPSLTSENLENLIKQLSLYGIREISGNFYIDNSEFDDECFAPGTTIDDLGESFYNPISSLIVDHKAAVINPINLVCFTDSKKLENIFFDLKTFLKKFLEKYKIKLAGNFEINKIPNNFSVISEHKSEKLYKLINHLNKESDNLYADCLFKKMGYIKSGKMGSWQTGSQALKDFLNNKLNINPEDIKLDDGSGLSRYNLISPNQIVTALNWAAQQPFFELFLNSLSISGIDGCLKDRLKEHEQKIKAKTGTLGGVSCLSGYINNKHDTLIFSILINGYISKSLYNPPCISELEDPICECLAKN